MIDVLKPTLQKGSTQSTTTAAAVKPGTTPPSGAGGAVGTATTQKGTTQVTQQVDTNRLLGLLDCGLLHTLHNIINVISVTVFSLFLSRFDYWLTPLLGNTNTTLLLTGAVFVFNIWRLSFILAFIKRRII